jgi:NADH:ubiquinone oxidoreductase subunit 5 (subunit L)/multisubunit Na+/H+ antiporter MnhA subunit
MNWGVAGPSIAIAVVGIALATVLYRKENPMPDRLANSMKGLYRAAYRRFYMDELYMFVTHKIIFNVICRGIHSHYRQYVEQIGKCYKQHFFCNPQASIRFYPDVRMDLFGGSVASCSSFLFVLNLKVDG